MRIQDLFTDTTFQADLEDAMEDCKRAYFYFDPSDDMHNLFAVQLVLARKLYIQPTNELQPEDEVIVRDDSALIDILSLVGILVSPTITALWSDEQCQQAEHWASLAYMQASDHDVEVPQMPEFLHKYEIPF